MGAQGELQFSSTADAGELHEGELDAGSAFGSGGCIFGSCSGDDANKESTSVSTARVNGAAGLEATQGSQAKTIIKIILTIQKIKK